jgi:hypothetical protein
VNTPGFAAEVSVYKTAGMYRGHSGASRAEIGSIVAQADCSTCEPQLESCENNCLQYFLTPYWFACNAICMAQDTQCQLTCTSPPPPPPRGCRPGTQCCGETMPNGSCRGTCAKVCP